MLSKSLWLSFLLFSTSLTSWASILVQTPLAQSQYQKLPDSQSINQFIKQLIHQRHDARYIRIGQSAGGLPLHALLLSNNQDFLQKGKSDEQKLTVMIVAAMHGMEPSGAEAVQSLVIELLHGDLNHYLKQMNFMILINANPDGRDSGKRTNAEGGNINIDFVNLNFPETRAIVDLIHRYKPQVVFDLHESSASKPILTQQQGYFKNVEAQYDCGNNPNIPPFLRQLMHDQLLPEIIKETQMQGLMASEYVGEILTLDQPVAHAGLGIANLRNYAALQGAVSFLVENRLDLTNGQYATPFNIKARHDKQLISLKAFLSVIARNQKAIQTKVAEARQFWLNQTFDQKIVHLQAEYQLNVQNPVKRIPMIQVASGKSVDLPFANHDFVQSTSQSAMPKAYVVEQASPKLLDLLKAQHIQWLPIGAPLMVQAIRPRITEIKIKLATNRTLNSKIKSEGQFKTLPWQLQPGDIMISTQQDNGLLAMLLLDFRASDSIYQNYQWRDLLIKRPMMPVFMI